MPSRVGRGPLPITDIPLEYPIFVDRGASSALGDIVHAHAPAHRIVIIADAVVASHHGDSLRSAFGGVHVDMLTVPPGEAEKTRERWSQLTDQLFELECGRDTTIVAVGGGVVCDLAGFVASTFMRGVAVVQCPTTLLAMVDASVGGKTGVDTPHGKNMVGAFHDPNAVVMDVATLNTLPTPLLRAGLAEVIKHGVIADATYFKRVVAALPDVIAHGANADALPSLIIDSVRIKANVVSRDRREGGLRETLNFGHTIAHAIEQASDFAVSHGAAVAIGMVVEARIGELVGVARPGISDSIAKAVRMAGLPAAMSELPIKAAGLSSTEDLVALTRSDKKVRAGAVRYALPSEIGRMHTTTGGWSVAVTDGIVQKALSLG